LEWYREGFAEAIELAATIDDYPGYFFSVQHFMQGFQDGHLGALAEDWLTDPRLSFNWPSFIVGHEEAGFVVRHSVEDAVPVGARLVSCDGRAADGLGEVLQRFHGLWSVPGARNEVAPALFIDAGNPFVDRPAVCRWEADGTEIETPLDWRPIAADDLRARVRDATARRDYSFGVRRIDGGFWIGMPSFALGSPSVEEGMRELRIAMSEWQDEIRSAELVVLDVRGNGGGSSSLGVEIAEALWGPEVVQQVQPGNVVVDWRVSAGNARFLRRTNLARLTARYGAEDPSVRDYADFVAEFDRAVERGDVYYRTGAAEPDEAAEGVASPAISPVQGRVFFLTDHACFSACLDFADVVLSIPGVEHIGLETRADAVYIDNRAVTLPSGMGLLGFSMKVYRNRARGHNESYVPTHQWEGDISEDRALEQWVGELGGR